MDDVIRLIEDRLTENNEERARLTRESSELRTAATLLRTGEALGIVMARLRAAGIEPADWPVAQKARD
jgi:hypothetical protein